jgi:hypothetical protein
VVAELGQTTKEGVDAQDVNLPLRIPIKVDTQRVPEESVTSEQEIKQMRPNVP